MIHSLNQIENRNTSTIDTGNKNHTETSLLDNFVIHESISALANQNCYYFLNVSLSPNPSILLRKSTELAPFSYKNKYIITL